jgi:hypothetical protein
MTRIARHARSAPTPNADDLFRISLHVKPFRHLLDVKQNDRSRHGRWTKRFKRRLQDSVSTTNGGDFTATIRKEYFPYFVQGRDINISKLELYVLNNNELSSNNMPERGTDTQVFLIVKYYIS